jgi:hypothetical protein
MIMHGNLPCTFRINVIKVVEVRHNNRIIPIDFSMCEMYNEGMDIETKCSIIEEFMRNFGMLAETYENENYVDFRIYNDLGVPLAQAVTYDLINLQEEGKNLINETWISFCNMLEVDPDEEYDSLQDIIPKVDDEE